MSAIVDDIQIRTSTLVQLLDVACDLIPGDIVNEVSTQIMYLVSTSTFSTSLEKVSDAIAVIFGLGFAPNGLANGDCERCGFRVG